MLSVINILYTSFTVFRQPNEREGLFSFNKFDEKAKISRVSLQGKYKVVNGLPLNPVGRTGIIGRGLFGRWGPNIGFNALVTRWELASSFSSLSDHLWGRGVSKWSMHVNFWLLNYLIAKENIFLKRRQMHTCI